MTLHWFSLNVWMNGVVSHEYVIAGCSWCLMWSPMQLQWRWHAARGCSLWMSSVFMSPKQRWNPYVSTIMALRWYSFWLDICMHDGLINGIGYVDTNSLPYIIRWWYCWCALEFERVTAWYSTTHGSGLILISVECMKRYRCGFGRTHSLYVCIGAYLNLNMLLLGTECTMTWSQLRTHVLFKYTAMAMMTLR